MNAPYIKEVAYSIVKILAEGPLTLEQAKETLKISENLLAEIYFDEECQIINKENNKYGI